MANALGIEGNTLRIRDNAVCIGCCSVVDEPLVQTGWTSRHPVCGDFTGFPPFVTRPVFGQDAGIHRWVFEVESIQRVDPLNRPASSFVGTFVVGTALASAEGFNNPLPTLPAIRAALETTYPTAARINLGGYQEYATVGNRTWSFVPYTILIGTNPVGALDTSERPRIIRAFDTPIGGLFDTVPRYLAPAFSFGDPPVNLCGTFQAPFGFSGGTQTYVGLIEDDENERSYLENVRTTSTDPFAGDGVLQDSFHSWRIVDETPYPELADGLPSPVGVIPTLTVGGRSALPPTDPRIAALSPENNTCRGCGDG